MQGIDLVFHQGDEGRDDKGEPVEKQGGELVAEGLSPAGRKDGKRRSVGEECFDDSLLTIAEFGEAEMLFESVGERSADVKRMGFGGTNEQGN